MRKTPLLLMGMINVSCNIKCDALKFRWVRHFFSNGYEKSRLQH